MTKIDPATSALVLVDLQVRVVALPTTPHSGEEVVANALRLRTAFRAAGAPVFLRGKGVRTVNFGGIATEFGVESTLHAS
jgi:nicotinamidase-related amidase